MVPALCKLKIVYISEGDNDLLRKGAEDKTVYIFVYIEPEEGEVRWMLQLKPIRFRHPTKWSLTK